MNGLLILLIAIIVLLAAYLLYGRYLARTWGVDPNAKTPAYELQDGVDYVPADTNVVFGHQFASIAGAAAINGPIQASVFGWVPVLLWILLGGVFFGAVQDFASMYASVKNKGRTIGYIIETYIGKTGKKLFLLFCWLFSILVVAAFVDIVAGTFNGYQIAAGGAAVPVPANGSVATTSLIFIVEAVALGCLLRFGRLNKWANTAIALVMLVCAIALGLRFPLYIGLNSWHLLIFLYVLIASVAPIWALLQPRDYLNSYLLIAMIAAAVIGVLAARPPVNLPAFSGFTVGGQTLFPFLFAWVGLKNTAAQGVIPDTVIWSFYIGAAILILCVIYTSVKVKEMPPKEYAEYHGITQEEEKEKVSMLRLLVRAPKAFWTVGLVQFFCWFAFMFMWTYTNGSIAANVFGAPVTETLVDGVKRVVLDTTSLQYQEAANWVGVLFAVQAIGSVLWAVCIPLFKNRKVVYALSLALGGIGFISTYFIHNQYLLFVSFILIGCAWAAMLALPFTILTNSLSGGHMGTYLGLFNGTICVPQIVAAALGGSILALFTPEGGLPPEINMLVMAGVMLIVGACCVGIIKEKITPHLM